MPLYEYECDACGHRFEVIQKFSDPLVDQCPKCGSTVHKLMSSPAFHLKGTGWYVTDYAKKDGGAAARAEGGPKSASDAKETDSKTGSETKVAASEGKSESKPEAKAESKAESKSASTTEKKTD